MKKILLLTIIALCAIAPLKAQDIVNLRMDRGQMGLRGNVASMDEDILLRKDYFREDWPERKWFIKDLRSILREDNGRIVTFNPAGRMLTITYTHQGKQGKTTRCTYAPNGLLTTFLGEGYKVEAKYNGNFADINVYAEAHDYSPNINLAKADLNTTPYTNSYPFDLKCRQELSEDGLVLNSSYYYVDSLPAKVCEYKYNHKNLLVSEKVVDYSSGEKQISNITYNYDNRGFLTKKTVHAKAADETYSYENNEFGDCVKMTVERPYGTIVYTFDYVYDSMSNWTVRLQFEDGVFNNAALRTLTYHKEVKESASKPQKKSTAAASKPTKKSDKSIDNKADKERAAAEKQAVKEEKARQQEEMKAQKARAKEAEKNMTKEERKAAAEERKAIEKAEKERLNAEKRAEKERVAAEKKAEKERKAAEKQAEKERKAAEKQAEKERKAA